MNEHINGNGKYDRSVIAYAFLAQATRGEGDLFSGLTPIFKPIAKLNAGKKFEPEGFAQLVNDLYGLKVHPWAIEDLIPRLEKSGLIHKVQMSPDIHELVYSEIQEEFNEVTDKDIKFAIQRFVEFSTKILNQNNLPVDSKALEDGFLSQLVDMSFVSILLKPDRTKEDKRGRSTLSFKKPKDQSEWEDEISARSKVEVLCAAFIVDVYHNDKQLYDLIMKIATGAILSEVILNIQDPGETPKLDGLNVAIDTPFLMSILDLTSEESHQFATEICDQIRNKGAHIITYSHSVEELKDNLKAVINKTKEGIGFGATSRRLASTSFSAYANAVLQNTESILNKTQLKIVTPPNSDNSFQYFTEKDKNDFQLSLGFYQNRTAQERDAESIAATIRLRRGKQAKMGRLSAAGYILITENTRVVDQSIRFLKRRGLFKDGEVPPAISEKYLAGLLWALYGGKGNELTQHVLLANCAAALEPRSDVVAQMHRFLSEIDPAKADIFSSLMTEERAGQYAMQLSLGDSALITKNNAPVILDQIKNSLIERHQAEKTSEIQAITIEHEQELRKRDEASQKLKSDLLEVSTENLKTRQELSATNNRLEAIGLALDGERNARIEEKRRLVERCVRKAASHERNIYIFLALLAATTLAVISWFSLDSSNVIWIKSTSSFVAFILSIFLFWKVPDLFFSKHINSRRQKRFLKEVDELGLSDAERLFSINWETKEVSLKLETPKIKAQEGL